MNLLSKRAIIAIAAVVDVAHNAGPDLVNAGALYIRHQLPPRYLEPLLQALVQANILKGARGPRGGYTLARGKSQITVGEIVRTVLTLSAASPIQLGGSSKLIKNVVEPRIRVAGEGFLINLDALTVQDLCEAAIAEGLAVDANKRRPSADHATKVN
jgi:Rrf2 family iron-sulfur cluster assembly transcriptional regulator